MNRRRVLTVFVITMVLMILIPAGAVRANGVPVKIILTYLQGYSNWGPTGAAGVAAVNVREGDVRITATGLPLLPEDAYEGWLINTSTGDTFSVGKFNADENGRVLFEAAFDNIPDHHYNLFIISVEPKTDPDPANADSRKSIGGFYPNKLPSEAPSELPKTGDVQQTQQPGGGPQNLMYVIVGALAASMLAGVAIGRFTAAGRSRGK
jgi:hypothetical protein